MVEDRGLDVGSRKRRTIIESSTADDPRWAHTGACAKTVHDQFRISVSTTDGLCRRPCPLAIVDSGNVQLPDTPEDEGHRLPALQMMQFGPCADWNRERHPQKQSFRILT